ncbi:MAG: hypothetical protein RMM53_03095 [Bacteroidia bacterium]|nr:hypothetical protein [Bacteroidia bacterium]MDW8333184.1 hypothetical protein [Bacteroidia bacterium]
MLGEGLAAVRGADFGVMLRCRRWFGGRKKFDLAPGHTVEKAFSYDGTDYYAFTDPFNLPCERAFYALAFYEEFEWRCTRSYLCAAFETIVDALSPKHDGRQWSFDPETARKTASQALELMNRVVEPDLIYKLAAVMYFDENEDPYGFDYAYALRKIERWKRKGPRAFFLRLPLKDLLPSWSLSAEDLAAMWPGAQAQTTLAVRRLRQTPCAKSSTARWWNDLPSPTPTP